MEQVEVEREERVTMPEMLDLVVPTSRTKNWIGNNLINGEIQKEVNNIIGEINLLEEEPKKNIETVYGCFLSLSKLKKYVLNQTDDLAELQVCRLTETLPPRKEDEDEETYTKRSENFVGSGYKQYIEGVDFNNPDSLDVKMTELLSEHHSLHLFVDKSELIKSKVRISDYAMIAMATVGETVVREMLEYGVKSALLGASKQKRITPDHVIVDIKNSSFYGLFHSLPHYKNVRGRAKRRSHYEQKYKMEELSAHLDWHKDKKGLTKFKFEFPTFDQMEHVNGHATRIDSKIKKEDGFTTRSKYQWYGIDVEHSSKFVETKDFKSYIIKIYKNMIDNGVSGIKNTDLKSFTLSESLKSFLSNIIIDLYILMSGKIRLLLDLTKTKTVNPKIVLTALTLLLSDNYETMGGKIDWSKQHLNLFDSIKSKIEIKTQYNKT